MDRLPTRFDQVIFQLKATPFRLLRAWSNFTQVRKCRSWPLENGIAPALLLAQSQSALWDPTAPHAEKILQAGKVQNLRTAARKIDGCQVPAGQCFSFWRQVGWPGKSRGYVQGRELRHGCLIPTTAGGLCQLSNALHEVALQAGLTIQERHAHTRTVPGSPSATGRDATVFWNYVDLRFSSIFAFQIRIAMTSDDLIVQLWRHDR